MFSQASLLISALAVFVGGVLGGFVRWCFMTAIDHPLAATLTANLTASAIMGFTLALPGQWQTFAGIGFAGSLSTLAMLARQLGQLIDQHEYAIAAIYGVGTALLAVCAAAIGIHWALLGFGPA